MVCTRGSCASTADLASISALKELVKVDKHKVH